MPPVRHFLILAALCPAPAATQWCPAHGPEAAPPGLTAVMPLAGADEPGERLTVSGVIRHADGITPAAGVVLYAYQTDRNGRYRPTPGDTGMAIQHGHLRGWARTGADGRYTLHTIRPGPYPGRPDPAHIHLQVQPPGGIGCYIDEIEFTDDPRLTPAVHASRAGHGGPGIVTPVRHPNGTWSAVRDITLWPSTRVDTLRLDPSASRVAWLGTKFRGAGKHEGTVRLRPGVLMVGGDGLLAGTITIDMRTIEVTDIPVWEPVPRSRLQRHLLGEDFFDVPRFPTASLEVLGATRTAPATWHVRGRLTIRDSTRTIGFDVRLEEPPEAAMVATAHFRINRHLWGVTYRGSELGNDLVDDDITFRVRLVARR